MTRTVKQLWGVNFYLWVRVTYSNYLYIMVIASSFHTERNETEALVAV